MISAFKNGPIGKFLRDRRGNIALTFALALPALGVGAMAAIELSTLSNNKSRLQSIADGAAIAGAREMRLGNANETTILNVVRNFVAANANSVGTDITPSGIVAEDKSYITVQLEADAPSGLAGALGLAAQSLHVTATAKVVGGAPLCLIGLDRSAQSTLYAETKATIQARNCAVYSNSTHPSGLKAGGQSRIEAAFICSAGGKQGQDASYSPLPELDCPQLPDPLSERPAPVVGSCDPALTGLVISGETRTLLPGVYCGGLTLDAGSNVTLSPGVYVFKDGRLIVDGASTLAGSGVGMYFTGDLSGLDFMKNSRISLSAPVDGAMAGMLIFQDRAAPTSQKFEISSDGADTLLGTIYIPRGRFYSGGEQPIAQNSAYTIIVARTIEAEAGPTLVLNSNYSATNVPVPNGVGPLSSQVRLAN